MTRAQEFAQKLLTIQQTLDVGSQAMAEKVFADLMLAMEKAVREGKSAVLQTVLIHEQSTEYNWKVVQRIITDRLMSEGFLDVGVQPDIRGWFISFSLPPAITPEALTPRAFPHCMYPASSLPGGLFVVIEGADLTGKTTQTDLLANLLDAPDKPVLQLSFPNYPSETGKFIHDWLVGKLGLTEKAGANHVRDAYRDALMFQCVQTTDKYAMAGRIRSARHEGRSVVSCRWWPSALVYGADDGLDPKWLLETSDSLPQPDVYILLDGDRSDAKSRAASRSEKADRFDVDMAKQQRVADAYRKLWKDNEDDPDWQVVDARGSKEEVAERVKQSCLAAQAGG